MNQESEAKTAINLSYFSLLSPKTPWSIFYSQERITELAKNCGYEGFEVVPTFLTVHGFQLRRGKVEHHSLNFISSGHQSPHDIKFPRKLKDLPWFIIFRNRTDSLNDLAIIQRLKGQNLPVVFYERSEDEPTLNRFTTKTIQPHPGFIEYTGAQSLESLTARTQELGATGFCLDTYHLRRGDNFLSADWRKSLAILLPHTQEVHLSVGRVDSSDSRIDTMAEWKDLRSGENKTEIREILKFIGRNWRGLVVIEIPAEAHGKILFPKEFIEINSRLVEEIGRLMTS